jgi:hypothetical protein
MGLIGNLKQDAASSLKEVNTVLPLRQAKLLINKRWSVTIDLLLSCY